MEKTNGGEILYQGHGSLRITTSCGTVVYVDPYLGEGYDRPADLILVTHQHHDHTAVDRPARKEDCVLWQNMDALQNGVYRKRQFKDVSVEALEAYNRNHPKEECVGYLLAFDGKTVYVAGDTSKTEQMQELKDRKIDYVFLPIDGVYNMGPKEAGECARLIGAAHVVPYHMAPGKLFDRQRAQELEAAGRMIVEPGETIRV